MYLASINKYPTDPDDFINLPQKSCSYIIPDLHANPLLLLQHLLRNHIMRWNSDADTYWKTIVDMVAQPTPLTGDTKLCRQFLKKIDTHFVAPIEAASFNNKHHLILLGDVIGDRGPNDWYMLLLLKILKKNKIKFTINFSNHDFETYLWAIYHKFSAAPPAGIIINTQRESLIHFHECYRHASVTTQQKIQSTYKNCYLKYLTLFTYHFDRANNRVIITTHAPGSISLLKDIAAQFNISKPDLSTPHKLMRLLNKLNKQFKEVLINNPQYFVSKLCPLTVTADSDADFKPIFRAIWGRQFELQENRHQHDYPYQIDWICGHLGGPIDSPRVTNLDISNLGKDGCHQGKLSYLILESPKAS